MSQVLLNSIENPSEHTMTMIDISGLELCGSRYFAAKYPAWIQIKEDTDWDYFFDSSRTDIHDRLLASGFIAVIAVIAGPYTFDHLVHTIYTHPEKNVQVIARREPRVYRGVIETMAPQFYRDYLWKSGPMKPTRDQIQAIFNQLFLAAGAGNLFDL